MKKIDMKKTLDERVRNTEWTDENTWNVLRKIRNTKAARREFSLRRLMPAAVALLLVMGIGVATLTGTPGNPDSIRDKAQYTAQPLVTALSGGQGEGIGDLPAGDTEKKVIDELREYYPEAADQMMPVNLSDERDGILFEVISGYVKGKESWILYSLQGVDGKDPGTPYSSMLWEDFIGEPDCGEDPLLYVDEKEHKAYFCSYTQYRKPISTDARAGSMGASYYESKQLVKLDALQLLKEYGITSEGVLSPERLPGINADGTPLIHEKVKVLDYNQPQLNIPVVGDVVLTGIGWVDGDFHVQLHNPNARPMAGRYVEATSNWDAYPDYEGYWKEGLIDYVVWDETGDGSMDWSEIVLHCDQEYLEKMKLRIEVSVLYDIVDGNWKIKLPLSMICPESEPVEVETKSPVLDADIAYDISEFFRDWAAGDAELMWGDVTPEWRLSREDGDGSLRSLIASGTPRRYQINDITDGASDGGKIITCTVEMTIPGTEEIEIRRYRVSVKPTEHGFYKVDPAGFIDWEDGEYDPAMEMVLVDQTTVLNKLQSDGYSDTTKYLKPMNLICEKQGIRLNVMSGGIRDQEGWFVCAVEDMEGAYADFPIDPVFSGNFGAEAEVTSTRMYRNALEHYTVYMVYVNYKQPVTPEDCTVTLNMDSVMVHEGAQADLVPLLQEHAKTVEGVELPQLATIILRNRDRGATEVPGLKVLDYTQPLNIPLFNHTYLANAGWIDGKLHVQICHTNRTPDSYDALWINTLLDGKMDILRKEADYSPVDWYDDKAYWYEYIFDYTPEDIEQLEMTAAFLDGRKELKDDWSVSFPLSTIYEESEPAAEETKAQPGYLLDDMLNVEGTEVKLHAIDQNAEKQGIRVDIIGGMATGNECWVKYSVQDVENRYSGLEFDPEGYINTICPEDAMSAGELDPERTEVMTITLGTDEVTHTSTFLTRSKHSWPILSRGQAIVFGLKDLKLTRHTTVDLLQYAEEYAKPEEGEPSRTYNGQKILNTSEKLNIPMGRDDVLLTGIGWIDNKLHVRFEYTGEGEFLKNGKPYGQACNVWISGDYTDPSKAESRVDYTMLTGADKAGTTPNRFEAILECGPDNYKEAILRAHIEVIEDAVQDEWAVSFPVSTIYEESEPAEEAPETEAPVQNTADSEFTIKGTTLVKYNGKGGEVIVPDGIEKLEKEAFQFSAVTRVNLPETVKEIGSHCFYGCNSLTEINLPAALKGLEEMAQVFGDNTALKAFSVAEGNRNYKAVDGVLFTADGKTLLYYPDGKENTEYSIPEGTVRLIENGSFDSSHLVTINIPSTVMDVGEDLVSFVGLPNLREINVSPDNKVYRSIDGVLYTSDTLMCYPNAKEGKELKAEDFPAGLKRIAHDSFWGNRYLETVELPDGLEELGGKVFTGADSLKTVVIPASVTKIGHFTFTSCMELEQVTILNPDVLPDDYSQDDPKTYNIFWDANEDAVIRGYAGGKLQEYAKKCGLRFVDLSKEEAVVPETASSSVPERSGRPIRAELELSKDKLSGPETIDVTIMVTNVSGDTLAGPVILYDPDGNQVAEYSEADFAAGETKEWTGKWTVTEAQLAEGKVGFSVKYSDYREGTTELMAHKLTFSKSVTRE